MAARTPAGSPKQDGAQPEYLDVDLGDVHAPQQIRLQRRLFRLSALGFPAHCE